jgi:SAM-dependent methyltransferase
MTDSVFGSSYASAYDALYREKDYDAECALIREAFAKVAASPIGSMVDFGCGTGEHALRFAHTGVHVHGIDLSPEMLELAQSKVKAVGLDDWVRFTIGDIATTNVGGPFDAASMMFAVLCYQTTNEQLLQTLRNVRAHLSLGAPFIADVWYGPAVLSDRPGDRVREIQSENGTLLRTTRTDIDTTSHTADVHFGLWELQGDKVASHTNETHRMRYLFPQEIRLLLELSGFNLVSLTAFPTLDADVSDQSWNAIILAQAV